MGVSYEDAKASLDEAVRLLFDADPAVRSVGITRHDNGFGYRAVRNNPFILLLRGASPDLTEVRNIQGVPVKFTDTPGEVESLVGAPAGGPTSGSAIPETGRHRGLVCGLQIQNFDDDLRQGVFAHGQFYAGTLGCFVRLPDGEIALLSNNHVVAGENRGLRGGDRILQPGSRTFAAAHQIATLRDYVALRPSVAGALPKAGTVMMNEVDAGVAALDDGITWTQGFLPSRGLPPLSGIATARLGEKVCKVGRRTGLTRGEVIDVSTTVGPVAYDPGPCWFQDSITIEGLHGIPFSDKGDSGAVIVNASNQVVGLLYAGNGTQTFACPIDKVLAALSCTIA